MKKTDMIEWLKEGNLTIPSMLISQYKNMKLNEMELMLILHVFHFSEKGNDFPTPVELAARMTISSFECTEMLRSLIQRGFIRINDGDSTDGIRYEKYTLEPLWEKLIETFVQERQMQKESILHQQESNVYTSFEIEFGRPLSPFECETLSMWMDDDHHDPIIIKAALREAVISGKLNFRYIDRILFEWKKNGIKTIEQARSYGRKFRQHQSQTKKNTDAGKISVNPVPFYNWLEQ